MITDNLLAELAEAGLTGRGGAAFSTSVKLNAAFTNSSDLIVNACDGEIGAHKDAFVVEHHLPELVAGARLVARRRRQRVWFAAHRGSRTLALLAEAGVRTLEVPHRFVSSEGTALVSLAHGGLARPLSRRTNTVDGARDASGRRIRPSVVLNAETLWRVAQIAEHGAAWFRSFGTADEPGPRLASVVGHVSTPSVVETQAGVPLLQLLDAAGGLGHGARHLLVGGLGGAFLTTDEARDTVWTTPSLRRYGASVGPGIVTVLDPARCPLMVVGELLDYAAGESAGQCGPCMFGLPATATAWRQVRRTGSPEALHELEGHLGLLPGRGACAFPTGVAGFGRSALRVFGDEIERHREGRCCALERTPAHA